MCPLWPLHWVLMLLFLFCPLWFLSCEAAKAVANWGIQFTPQKLEKIYEGESKQISFTTTDLTSKDISSATAYVLISDPNIAFSSIREYQLRTEPINGSWSSSFNITGNFLGYTDVRLKLSRTDEKKQIVEKESDPIEITVMRKPTIMDKVFTSSVIILVSIIFITFGCALDFSLLKKVLLRPIGPVIGLLCHYLILPVVSYGLGLLLFPSSVALRLGIFFTGVTPAGGASNMWTASLGGNLTLSVTMTAVSTLASFIMIPFWVFTLGQVIFAKGSMGVPYTRIMTSAVGLFIPLIIGYALQVYCKRVSNIMVRILKPFSAALIAFIVVFAIITNLYLFKLFTWQIIIVGLALPFFGYIIGWILASITKQQSEDILAISIETGVQNTGIAIFLLRFCLDQPEADLTTVVPVSVAAMTPIPVLILFIIRRICYSSRKDFKTIHGSSVISTDTS